MTQEGHGNIVTIISVPYTMHLKGWGNEIGSSAVAIGGGIAIKQIDEGAGSIILTNLGVTRLKAIK